MRQFFVREVLRYTKRKDAQRLKAQTLTNSGSGNAKQYQEIIRKLPECNQSLAKKCKSYCIKAERVHVWSSIYSFM